MNFTGVIKWKLYISLTITKPKRFLTYRFDLYVLIISIALIFKITSYMRHVPQHGEDVTCSSISLALFPLRMMDALLMLQIILNLNVKIQFSQQYVVWWCLIECRILFDFVYWNRKWFFVWILIIHVCSDTIYPTLVCVKIVNIVRVSGDGVCPAPGYI